MPKKAKQKKGVSDKCFPSLFAADPICIFRYYVLLRYCDEYVIDGYNAAAGAGWSQRAILDAVPHPNDIVGETRGRQAGIRLGI